MQKPEGEGECYNIRMSTVRFTLDNSEAGKQILRGNSSLQQMQNTAFNGLLGTVTAQFFQQFGFEGKFEVVGFTTDRSSVKIQASDKRTAGALKSQPGWLATFSDNIVI